VRLRSPTTRQAPAQADGDGVVGLALGDYLAGRRVGRITAADPAVVSINDPVLQAELDGKPAVRALLDSPLSRQALLPDRSPDDRRVHLDQAAVRLSGELGRDLTRACSLALRDRQDRPDVIHYRSRHDDREDCWAIYDHTAVSVGDIRPLSPEDLLASEPHWSLTRVRTARSPTLQSSAWPVRPAAVTARAAVRPPDQRCHRCDHRGCSCPGGGCA